MIKYFKNLVSIVAISIVTLLAVSCDNKPYSELTPEQQQKEYAKFQADSVKVCTQDEYLAKQLILEAFDRGVYYSKTYKKEKTTVVYNDEIHGWVGTIEYHTSNGNVYAEGTKVYHLFIWYENNGLAKDSKVYYKVQQVAGDK